MRIEYQLIASNTKSALYLIFNLFISSTSSSVMWAVFEALSIIGLKWLRNSDLVNSTKSFSFSPSINAALVRATSSDLLSSPSEVSLLRRFLRILSFPDLKKGMASGSWRSEADSGGVAMNSWVQLGQTTLRPTRSGATEQLAVQLGQL